MVDADLMLQGKAPLHEIGRAELAIRNGRDGNRLKAGTRIRARGRAGELTLREAGIEGLVGGDSRVDCAIRNSRSNGCPAHVAQETPLKGLRIRRIRTHEIDNASGQNVTEQSKSGSQHRLWPHLPGNRRSRLQDG